MGIELPGRAPVQGGDKVTLVHVEAVQKLQIVRPLAGLKIVVIYRVVDEVAGPAQHADGKAQQAVVPIALPCDLHVLRVGRFSRFGGVQRGLHVISEALHDLPVDGLGLRRVGLQLRNVTDVGIFRAVFVGEGVLLVIDLGDEAVVIDLRRRGRRRRPGGAGLGNGFLAAGGQLGTESKAKERAQRPVKEAMVLHKKYLQHSLGGNPLPLGGGRSPVCRDASSLQYFVTRTICTLRLYLRRLCR